jgi:hypothetical protein
MTTDGAEDRMKDVFLEFLRAIPKERREELRTLVRAARAREQRRDAAEPWEPEERDAFDELAAKRRPLPPLEPRAARLAADRIMLAAMREAGRFPGTPPQQPLQKPFVLLSSVQAEPLRWLSPGRIAAGKITILDGDPGLGKSTLLCELAARVSRGEALPGGEPSAPRGVVLISAEDDLHDTIRPRIDAAGGDPNRIVSLLAVPDGSLTGRPFVIPDDAGLLEMLVQKIDAALVVIDPLVAYLHGALSVNSDHDVRRALSALKVVGERTGAAIVVVRHLNKSAGSNPLYRGGGSIGIIGAARCGLLLAADPRDPERRILAVTKGNLARPPAALAFRLAEAPGLGVARVVWDGETRWTAAALLSAGVDGDEDHSTLAAARAWLRAVLADGPRPAKEVEQEAAAQGITTTTFFRARKAEGIVSRKERTQSGRWLLSLPAPTAEASEDAQGSLPSSLDSLDSLFTDERRCVDCQQPLADRQGNRCPPCLAKKLTGET